MTVALTATKCKICGLWNARVTCGKCQKPVCNIHWCDVCRFCSRDCVCWETPHSVYHPPPDEPPPR